MNTCTVTQGIDLQKWLSLSWLFGQVSQQCAVPENIHTPPMEGFLFCTPIPPENSGLFSYIASINLGFNTPFPLGISNDLPWGGHGFFQELHNEWQHENV